MWIWVSPLLTGKNSIMLFSFATVDVALSYTSTASVLLVGYGFILMVVLLFTGLHAFQQYSRGERLTITIYFDVLTKWVCWMFSRLRMLPSIHGVLHRTCSFLQHFFWGIIGVANVSLNLAAILVIWPLIFSWLLDICTSELFGAKIPQTLQLLFASSFASNALHWLIGCICLKLHYSLSSLLCPVCHTIVFVQHVSIYVVLLFQNLTSCMHVFCLSIGIEARS
jgi:E3 ubiquitin-protein ligase MARCH6